MKEENMKISYRKGSKYYRHLPELITYTYHFDEDEDCFDEVLKKEISEYIEDNFKKRFGYELNNSEDNIVE